MSSSVATTKRFRPLPKDDASCVAGPEPAPFLTIDHCSCEASKGDATTRREGPTSVTVAAFEVDVPSLMV